MKIINLHTSDKGPDLHLGSLVIDDFLSEELTIKEGNTIAYYEWTVKGFWFSINTFGKDYYIFYGHSDIVDKLMFSAEHVSLFTPSYDYKVRYGNKG